MRSHNGRDDQNASQTDQDAGYLPRLLTQAMSSRVQAAAYENISSNHRETPWGQSLEEDPVLHFTAGSLIATPCGTTPVDLLEEGDRVITRDSGIRTVLRTTRQTFSGNQLLSRPELMPVLIRKNALGTGIPDCDMMVGPMQRILIANQLGSIMFGEREVLVEAQHLTDIGDVSYVTPLDGVTYFNLEFEHYEVVLANGIWIETAA